MTSFQLRLLQLPRDIFASFDVGGSTIRHALFNDQLQLLGSTKIYLEKFTKPEDVVEKMSEMCKELCDTHDVDPDSIAAFGVGLAAQLSPDQKHVDNAPNLGWKDVPFEKMLNDALLKNVYCNEPTEQEKKNCADKKDSSSWDDKTETTNITQEIFLYNDLNAILAGEYTAGAAQGYKDVLAVYVGTGIGAAFICGDELILGSAGVAGEIGHIKAEPGFNSNGIPMGRHCGCGQYGCVEAYVSGLHLANQLRELPEEISREINYDISELEDSQLLKMADAIVNNGQQAPRIHEIWNRASNMLATVIASSVTLLNPALLLLGGGVLENLPNYRDMTLDHIRPQVVAVAEKGLQIKFSQLGGDQAGILGAAALAQRFSMKY